MLSKDARLTSYIYLLLVPIIVAAFGFGVGHVSYKIYLPLWLLNAVSMGLASWILGLNVVRNENRNSNLAKTAFFLVVPWILISMFAGLGPPPETPSEWTATATEQQVRYCFLVVSGVFVALAFVGLHDELKSTGKNFYADLGLTAILISIPLFIINMLYWGFYLTELFKIHTHGVATSLPDWFSPIRLLFGSISTVEVALTYFATFAFARSLKSVGWLSKSSALAYVFFSLFAFSIIVLSTFLSEPFVTAGFVLTIPAFPFIMPYYIGVNLLRRVGE